MNTSLLPEKDLDTKRRLALAKVYSLLLKIAEAKKNNPEPVASSEKEENATSTLKDNN